MSGSLESSLSSDSILCSVLYPYFLSFLRTWIKHGFLLSSDDFNVSNDKSKEKDTSENNSFTYTVKFDEDEENRVK